MIRGRLVILSGPSCGGKSPLGKALARFHPQLHRQLQPLVLFNSRAPRPGEADAVDYHFRTTEQMNALRAEERYVVIDVRGDLQAVDLKDLTGLLKAGDARKALFSFVQLLEGAVPVEVESWEEESIPARP